MASSRLLKSSQTSLSVVSMSALQPSFQLARLPPLSHFARQWSTSRGTRPRTFTSSIARLHELPSAAGSSPASSSSGIAAASPPTKDAVPAASHEYRVQPEEPRLSLTFTCTADECGTRSTHEFTKRSYTRGIVIVQCPGCANRVGGGSTWASNGRKVRVGNVAQSSRGSHLIADHLGWFKESTEEGKLKTVEDLMRAKGEKVKRGSIDGAGTIEYAPE